jgi:hypothetical protein
VRERREGEEGREEEGRGEEEEVRLHWATMVQRR